MKEGVDYPSMLIVGSKNDARTDPIHAVKFAAQARFSDVDHGQNQPIFLNVRSESGHQGGVGLETQAKQYAQSYAYLMNQLGLNPNEEK
jgi:prolyl oligopeptidase PreP (S9A serine peptidase family)